MPSPRMPDRYEVVGFAEARLRATDRPQAVGCEVGERRIAIDSRYQIRFGEDRPEDVHDAVIAAKAKTPRAS